MDTTLNAAEPDVTQQAPEIQAPPAPKPQEPRPVVSPKPDMDKKFDWFKSELMGLNNNLADVYHQGYKPEDHKIGPVEEYWNNPLIRKPYEDSFGPLAKSRFDQDYKNSKDKLDAYTKYNFDLNSTSSRTYRNDTPFTRKLEAAGKGRISKAPVESPYQFPENLDPWGRTLQSYSAETNTTILSAPSFGYREGAKNVLSEDGTFVPIKEYLRDRPNENMVYAMDENGQVLTDDNNLAYLRPLKYGEDKKSYEHVYTGDVANWFGSKGLVRSDWYAAQWLPKNVMNFSADVLDSGAEILKIFDNLWQSPDQSDWDKGLSQFQNNVASAMYVPTSEEGQQSWHSVEGIADQMAQIGGQLLGMLGVARGVSGLSQLAKLGAGTRAGSVAGRAWMASIASDDFVKQAREIGLSPKEQAATFGMYFTGMYGLAGISDILVNPVVAKQSQQGAIAMITKSIAKSKQAAGGKLTPAAMYQAVKNGRSWLEDTLRNAAVAPSKVAQVAGGMATESLEEQSEVWFDKLFKEAYNNIYGPYSRSGMYAEISNSEKDGRFNVSWDTLGTELAASATLGALGGGFFKAATMFSDNSKIKRETILSYGGIQNGYRDLRNRAQKMYDSDQLLPGGKTIDLFGQPIADGDVTKSRAYMVHQAIKNEIDMAEKLWTAYDATAGMDKTSNVFNIVRANYAQIFGDGGMERATTLGSDIATKLNRLSELQAELTAGAEVTAEKDAINKQEIATLETQLKDMRDGKYANRYLHQAVYNTSPSTGFISKEGRKEHERLDFEEFERVNNNMYARVKEVEKINNLPPIQSLKAALESTNLISREQADKLIAQLEEGMPTTDAGDMLGTPDEIKSTILKRGHHADGLS